LKYKFVKKCYCHTDAFTVIYRNNSAVPVSICLRLTREFLKLPEQVRKSHDADIPVGLLRFHPEIPVIDILSHMWTATQ